MRSTDELTLIASIADDLPCGVWVATAPEGRFVYSNKAFDEIMGMGPVPQVGVGEYTVPYGIYGRNGALYPEERLPFVRALRERTTVVEERLCSVVGNAPIVLFALDLDGKITFVDGRGLARLGRTPEDFLGKSAFEAYANAGTATQWIKRALAGETVSYLAELPPEAMFETRLNPVRNDAGEVVGVIGVSTDVTDRHRMQAQLARAERLASVGLLAAGVVHEINNPLSYVIGNLELISSGIAAGLRARPDDEMRGLEESARDARHGAERVRTIVRDLKTFSRVREQRACTLDVRAPLEASIAMAQNEIRHRAQLKLDLSPVPLVLGEEGRLAQVFLNLLVNAAHSIAEGEADKNEIRVTTRPDPDGGACVEVSDTGVGIEPAHLPRVFDPFFTTKGQGVGTGLGLSICHGVVTDLGGRIEVESIPGHGTTFRVILPPVTESSAKAQPRSASEASAGSTKGLRPSVLVIDDEPLLLKMMGSLLEPDHVVTCEARADAALTRIRNGERFDAILCDLMMPQLTGMDLYEALLEIAPRQAEAMLFVTGGAFTPRARAFLDHVPNVTIDKPFDAATLTAGLRRLFGSRPS
jgi:PAS domain S-box-containing protein